MNKCLNYVGDTYFFIAAAVSNSLSEIGRIVGDLGTFPSFSLSLSPWAARSALYFSYPVLTSSTDRAILVVMILASECRLLFDSLEYIKLH